MTEVKMITEQKLKPCPICKGEPFHASPFPIIACLSCNVSLYGKSAHDAIEKWNRCAEKQCT